MDICSSNFKAFFSHFGKVNRKVFAENFLFLFNLLKVHSGIGWLQNGFISTTSCFSKQIHMV